MCIRKTFIILQALILSTSAIAVSPWLENLDHPDKQQQIDLRWTAYGGQADFQFYYGMLDDMEIQMASTPLTEKDSWDKHHHILQVKQLGGLDLQVPFGKLEAIPTGTLQLDGVISFSYKGTVLNLQQLAVRPTNRKIPSAEIAVLDVVDSNGNIVFYLDHIHALLDKEAGKLTLKNMDLIATKWFAEKLGNKYIENLVIAQVHINTELNIPANAYRKDGFIEGLTCAGRPTWPGVGVDADVELIELTAQFRRNLPGDRIVITPSARLRNSDAINAADVAWWTKFSGPFPPYNNDQHPYLTWAMFREVDGRFEQIGLSGIKHAFLTINANCAINCGNSNILWPGCEDVYGVGTNDSGGVLGPRDEVNSFLGLWESTGSFFDPGSTGNQTNSSNNTDENRMVVEESLIGDSNNDYYISGWYTIRDDVNIFNTMGFRKYNLTDNGATWGLQSASSFTVGPASDAYVSPSTGVDLVNLIASQRVTTLEGHLTVAAKIFDLGGGVFRYNYMVENHDYDPKLDQFEIPLIDSASLSSTVFADLDVSAANNWSFNQLNNKLTITGTAANAQAWGSIYSFSFTTNVAPVVGSITLQKAGGGAADILVATLVPDTTSGDLIFADSFE